MLVTQKKFFGFSQEVMRMPTKKAIHKLDRGTEGQNEAQIMIGNLNIDIRLPPRIWSLSYHNIQ